MTALVLLETLRSTSARLILSVSRSTSAKMTRAPRYITAWAVETNVIVGTITSSPGPTPASSVAKSSAAVALFNATAYGAPRYCANFCSNSAVLGPMPIQPLLRTAATASASSSPMLGRNTGIMAMVKLRSDQLVPFERNDLRRAPPGVRPLAHLVPLGLEVRKQPHV